MITADEARKISRASPVKKMLERIDREIRSAAADGKDEVYLSDDIFIDTRTMVYARITGALAAAKYDFKKDEIGRLRVWWDGK